MVKLSNEYIGLSTIQINFRGLQLNSVRKQCKDTQCHDYIDRQLNIFIPCSMETIVIVMNSRNIRYII